MTKYFAALLMLIIVWPSFAADPNGYTSQYECRAAGPNCDVDVAALVAQTCQQTITTSDSAEKIDSKLNGNSNVICVQNGDYFSQKTWKLMASGTSGVRRVLRYTRSGDNNDEPWNQSATNQAKIPGIIITGNYWLVHRLTLTAPLEFGADNGTGGNNIANRMLIEGTTGFMVDNHGGPSVTVQNSVIRNSGFIAASGDRPGFGSGGATDLHIINNEIYDFQGDEIIIQGSNNVFSGLVIENNDLYITNRLYSDGSGRLTTTGNFACAENGIDIKGGGTATSPLRIIHNRIWGHRATDRNCADGSDGEAMIFHTASGTLASYGMVQNNIFMDGTSALASPNFSPDQWSILGNIMYSFSGTPNGTLRTIDLKAGTRHEVYLNTIIDTNKGNSNGWLYAYSETHDVRCNVIIDGGASSAGSGVSDNQIYYNSTNGGEAHRIDVTISTRTNSTAYKLNQILRTGAISGCVNGTEAACFLYKVTVAGNTASSPPTYCSTLGCTMMDGSVQLQSIRGPYKFYRKLHTSPELHVIPYATAYSSAPEAYACPSSYSARKGVGINDQP